MIGSWSLCKVLTFSPSKVEGLRMFALFLLFENETGIVPSLQFKFCIRGLLLCVVSGFLPEN